MKRHCFLVLFFVVTVSASGRLGVKDESIVGGYKPIKDLKDPRVVEIGKYAVSEYNKRFKADLKFISIAKGESQVVVGINYRLILVVSGGHHKKYEAIVWEKEWEHYRKLISFKATVG